MQLEHPDWPVGQRALLQRARAAIARIHALGAGETVGHGLGHLQWAELIALILLNRSDEAVAAGRMALKNLSPELDGYQLLGALALLAASQGRLVAAARISGRDDAVAARDWSLHRIFGGGKLPQFFPGRTP